MTMPAPLVSIIIPVYNAERFVAATIESSLAQDWPNKEIIVVDDGSTDGSLDVIRRYQRAGVRVISVPNGGGSAARNKGFKASHGDYIQFLDHDDLLDAGKISAQMEVCGGRGDGPIFGLWSRFRGDASGAYGGWCPDARVRHDWSPVDWLLESPLVPTCAWLTPRALVEAAGLWNDSLVDNPDDDGEFFMRVFATANRVVFSERARAYFRTEDGSSAGHNRSATALASIFEVCKAYEAILRRASDTPAARRAAANRYLAFMHMAYPTCPGLIAEAEMRVSALGFDPSQVPNTPRYEQLSRLIGWRLARRLQQSWQMVRRLSYGRPASRH
jgi:glycosyltransferase involved in cell wall biosynthesis